MSRMISDSPYTEIARLKTTIDHWRHEVGKRESQMARQSALIAQLAEALEAIATSKNATMVRPLREQMMAALAAAKGMSNAK